MGFWPDKLPMSVRTFKCRLAPVENPNRIRFTEQGKSVLAADARYESELISGFRVSVLVAMASAVILGLRLRPILACQVRMGS